MHNFWKAIEAGAKTNGSNIKAELISDTLSACTIDEIIQFEIMLRQLLEELDNYKIVAAQKIMQGMVVDDSYLYFRCWIIGNGQKFFRDVSENPDNMVEGININEMPSFEELLYVSTNAYKMKIGQEIEDDNFPRATAINNGYDYDLGLGKTKGNPLSQEKAQEQFPKLWQLCRVDTPPHSVFEVFKKSGLFEFPWGAN
jgi:hypothetical protein